MPRKKTASAHAAAPVPAYKRGREFKVILPPELSSRIEARAREQGKPQSRVIIEDLSRIPHLEAQTQLHKLVQTMDLVLTHHSSRLVMAELSEQLFRAVDHVLAAQTAANHLDLLARLDGLRLLRMTMLRREKAASERPNLREIAPLAPETVGNKGSGEGA